MEDRQWEYSFPFILTKIPMRKVLLSLAVLVIIPVALSAETQKSRIKSEGDPEINSISTNIASKQAAYFAEHDTYWQGLDTIEVIDGTSKKANSRRKPHDVDKNWDEMGIVIGNSKFSTKVDTYESPDGFGYTVTQTTKDGTDICTKVIDFGTLGRSHDWECYNPSK